MTTDDRKRDLIEQAAKAIDPGAWMTGAHDPRWAGESEHRRIAARRQAADALAVFEAAQKPMAVTDDMVAEALDAKASMSQQHCYLYATEKCRCGEEWSDAHWMRFILERAMSRASVVPEEPEWEEKRVEQARIHYRYGVNSGTLTTINTPECIAAAIEREEQRTMGPIGAHKIETRTEITRTSPWLPVEGGE